MNVAISGFVLYALASERRALFSSFSVLAMAWRTILFENSFSSGN
jgi:hypothetical protein